MRSVDFPPAQDLSSVELHNMWGNDSYLNRFVAVNGDIPTFISKEYSASESAKHVLEVTSPDKVLDKSLEHLGEIACVKDFDLENEIREDKLGGPIIEVAGPTYRGYKLINALGTMPEDMHVSNIAAKPYGMPKAEIDQIDYLADAVELPHPDASIGAIFAAAIGGGTEKRSHEDTQQNMFKEFMRVLKPGGYALVQDMKYTMLQSALEQGFTPMVAQVMSAQKSPEGEFVTLDVVFQKPQ